MSGILNKLGKKHLTDKSSDGPRWGYPFHDFLRHYESILEPMRYDKFTLVEIGVGNNGVHGGASIRMWREYLPNARIVGVDVNPNALSLDLNGADIHILDGEAQQAFLVLREKYNDVRIIVEDALHSWSNQKNILENLFPVLEPGGYYIVEDLDNVNYVASWYEEKYDRSMLQYLKDRVDALCHPNYSNYFFNLRRLLSLPPATQYIDCHLDAITFIPAQAAILKKNDRNDNFVKIIKGESEVKDHFCHSDEPLSNCAAKFFKTNAFAIAVVSDDNALLGIIAKSDLERIIHTIDDTLPVLGFCNRNPCTISCFDDVKQDGHCYHPVVSGDNTFLGFRYELPSRKHHHQNLFSGASTDE